MVEHNLAKVGVASSSLVFRSLVRQLFSCLFFLSDNIAVDQKVVWGQWIFPVGRPLIKNKEL